MYVLILISLVFATSTAYAQETVDVPVATPCFLQDDVGIDIYERCGLGRDWLSAVTISWDWILGGYFSLAIVCILCIATYQKFQKAIYPLSIGIMYLPISYAILPPQFLTMGILLVGILFGIYIWYAYIRQTRDF